jgi:hypothetical protein
MSIRSFSLAACTLALASVAFAGDMQPLMTVKGKQLMNEEFTGSSLPPTWKAAKGKWTIEDGALRGDELAADKHAAVAGADLKHANAIYQFDFKFSPTAKGAAFSLNNAKGHVCRVTLARDGFSLNKDGSKTDKADTAKKLDSCKVDFQNGQWYTMIVEINGDEMLARVDDQHFALGSDAKLNGEKTIVRFPITGEGMYFDNVKVWEATANPDWTATKSKLESAHPAKLDAPQPAKKAAKKK